MELKKEQNKNSRGFPGDAVVKNPPASAGSQVRALVQEDPTCCRATKPVSHNYWVRVPQLLKPTRLEPVLHNKRRHPMRSLCTAKSNPTRSNEDPMQPKINKFKKNSRTKIYPKLTNLLDHCNKSENDREKCFSELENNLDEMDLFFKRHNQEKNR